MPHQKGHVSMISFLDLYYVILEYTITSVGLIKESRKLLGLMSQDTFEIGISELLQLCTQFLKQLIIWILICSCRCNVTSHTDDAYTLNYVEDQWHITVIIDNLILPSRIQLVIWLEYIRNIGHNYSWSSTYNRKYGLSYKSMFVSVYSVIFIYLSFYILFIWKNLRCITSLSLWWTNQQINKKFIVPQP